MPSHEGLTDKQAAFVDSYVSNGGKALKAAEEAGYAVPQVECTRLLSLEHVRAAIKSAVETALVCEGGTVAWGLIIDAMRDESWPKHIRADLAKFTLKEGGYTQSKALETPGGKGLNEMTQDELADYIAKGHAALDGLKQAQVLEIEAVTVQS
jgi:hypothetical protein